MNVLVPANYADSAIYKQAKQALAKSGVCPLCKNSFSGLKKHFNSCYGKQLEKAKKTQSETNATLVRPNQINDRLDIIHEPDFSRQKWKCQSCDTYYKDLKSKPYANHLA